MFKFASHEVDDTHLMLIRRLLTLGLIPALRTYIERHALHLERSSSLTIRDQFGSLVKEAQEAFQIEEEHGAGSLLDLDDPLVKRLVGNCVDGIRAIPSHEVLAAQKYHASKLSCLCKFSNSETASSALGDRIESIPPS